MMRVLTTSMGVVMTAATEPAEPAEMAVIMPRSSKVPLDLLWALRYARREVLKCSYMGKCIAVKGRFLAASAV